MEKKLEPILKALQADFGASVEAFRGEPQVTITPDHIVEALTRLRDKYHFEQLVTLSAVDYWPQQEPRFHLVYQLRSYAEHMTLMIRVPVPGINPQVPTVSRVYANANWRERELWDMFGIKAEGHPDLRRILMPADWEGHPLRKDYPLGYEEPQFTFNYEEIDLRKPYARE
jgi:NADH-quinone oxidoreductase subunit C